MPTEYICCDHQIMYNSDFLRPGSIEFVENRHCRRCLTHWYDGKRYTRKEWDNFLESGEPHETT